jgi:exoribonuclease-2
VLWRIAQALEEERMAAGAVRIAAPEVEARPRPDGTIVLQRIEPDRPGRRLVAEMMILANSLAAAQCIKGHIPAPYRKQAPPDEPVGSLPTDSYDPVAVRRARRAMKRGEVSATPGPHAGLGLRAYLQATSPLRRYQDLVVHRQIAAHLAGRPLPYDQDAVARIAATTEEAERQARLLERARRDYWLLRWLEERTGKTAEAVVIETNARRTDIELSETLLGASIPARADHAPGQRLLLRIERVIPRASFIALREI